MDLRLSIPPGPIVLNTKKNNFISTNIRTSESVDPIPLGNMSGPTTTSPANKQADKIKSLLASYYESSSEHDREGDTRYGCALF